MRLMIFGNYVCSNEEFVDEFLAILSIFVVTHRYVLDRL